ncbi:MAG: glutamate--tRNA ligase [Arenicellales bacterium]|nr:glutamate--tRNA ligase [Arenicellales bacterium]
MSIRTRFAPSPTGYLHIGGVRTALFCWLYAKAKGGEFILRVEDTDQARSTQQSVDAIIEGMRWMALDYDEGPVFQSDRFGRYRAIANQLLDENNAYRCYCSKEELDEVRDSQRQRGLKPRYDRRCRDRVDVPGGQVESVIRFRTPLEGTVSFNDAVRGPISIQNEELDDPVIVRTDGTPTYNFTVVVDDIDMGISHVIRGDDHINNTPRQINIFRALDAPIPIFAHVPMIVGGDGQRLSKRHGAVSVLQYRDDGYLPEALRNYLVRLGWSSGDQEIFSLEDMIEKFDIAGVGRAASTFDIQKLRWLNQHYIKESDTERLASLLGECLEERGLKLAEGPPVGAVAEALRERAETIQEMACKSEYFYREFENFEESAAKKHLRPIAAPLLEAVRAELTKVTDWSTETIHEIVANTAVFHDVKMGKVAQPLRVAVSGSGASPSIEVTLQLVGKWRTLTRIDRALAYINERVVQNS